MSNMFSNALCKEAWDCWIREEGGAIVDDITAIIVHIPRVDCCVLTVHGDDTGVVRCTNMGGTEVAVLSVDRDSDTPTSIATMVTSQVASKERPVSLANLRLLLSDGTSLW